MQRGSLCTTVCFSCLMLPVVLQQGRRLMHSPRCSTLSSWRSTRQESDWSLRAVPRSVGHQVAPSAVSPRKMKPSGSSFACFLQTAASSLWRRPDSSFGSPGEQTSMHGSCTFERTVAPTTRHSLGRCALQTCGCLQTPRTIGIGPRSLQRQHTMGRPCRGIGPRAPSWRNRLAMSHPLAPAGPPMAVTLRRTFTSRWPPVSSWTWTWL
mmetsp:Transcript_3939/g.9877  ORF Transcript_3939/g.9877 Transcript_3939/m.9877 type:complete len:209 (-) Transcript_3939:140-766(-)